MFKIYNLFPSPPPSPQRGEGKGEGVIWNLFEIWNL
jgi:hypothetical protein